MALTQILTTDSVSASVVNAKIVDPANIHINTSVDDGEAHGLRVNAVTKSLEYYDGTEWHVVSNGLPVGNVANFTASAGDTKITLNWEDPTDLIVDDVAIAKWEKTKIVRKVGNYPANENDGVLVIENGIRDQYKTTGYEDTGLTNGTQYYYMAFPVTDAGIVTVDTDNRASATPSEIKIYGIEIDETNDNPQTAVTYTDSAVGFTPASSGNWGSWESVIKDEFLIKPCLLKNPSGVVNYYLKYDDYTKKSNGDAATLTGTDGDVMVEFGQELYWKFTRTGDKLKIQLSAKTFTGAVKYAFEIENGYNQFSFYPLMLTQIIDLLMFKNRDTQTALGRGYVDGNNTYANTGGTNSKTFNYGETTGKLQMKFLGMEDYWGNRRQWIDGCFYNDTFNMMIGKGSFNDTGSGYTDNGVAVSVAGGGYIDKVQGGNATGFIPKTFAGSETTHYADYGSVDGGYLPYFGGYYSVAGQAGGFHLTSATAATASAYIGGRLAAYFNSKLYIGAYLGVEQSTKLRSVSGSESAKNKTIGAFRTLAKANN